MELILTKRNLLLEHPKLKVCKVLPAVGVHYGINRQLILSLSTYDDPNLPSVDENLILNTSSEVSSGTLKYWRNIERYLSGGLDPTIWKSFALYNLVQEIQTGTKDQSTHNNKLDSLPALAAVIEELRPKSIIAFSGVSVYDWLRSNMSSLPENIVKYFTEERILRVGPHPSHPRDFDKWHNAIKQFLNEVRLT